MKHFILFFTILIFSFNSLICFANKKTEYQELIDKACESIYDDKYNQALKKINKAIKINPDEPDAYFTRAGLYLIKGKYKKALKDYEKVISISPWNSNDAKFFGELALNSLHYHNPVKFHKYNVTFRIGEAKVIIQNNEQQELVDKIIYAKGLIDGHSESLINYCSSTGNIPNKYLQLNLDSFKNTKANIDKIVSDFDDKTKLLIKLNYEYKVKNYDKIHNKDFEDMKNDMLEKNYILTKEEYCKSFDRDSEFFIKYKVERIKNQVPDLYVD